MISNELSVIQQNSALSAELAAAIDGFVKQGGVIAKLEGFVHRPKPEAKPYGRCLPESPVQQAKPKSSGKEKPPAKVPEAALQKILALAPTMKVTSVERETGVSRYMLNRLAKQHGFEFKKHDPRPNLQPPQIDLVADALNVLRIKAARDKGLARKQAARAIGISHTMLERLIKDYNIEFPKRPAGSRR